MEHEGFFPGENEVSWIVCSGGALYSLFLPKKRVDYD
jgi:hypothetical protein